MTTKPEHFSYGERSPSPRPSPPGEGEVFERLGVVTVERLLPARPLSIPSPGGEGQGEGEPTPYRIGTAKRARAAFTLVEVLAALAFMAIVIPVAVDGLRIANRAGQVGQRKAVAARIAERVLNEVVITGQFRSTTQSGTVQEGVQAYQWIMRSEPWPMDAMLLVTVQVNFPVQGREFDVRLSTLVDNSTQ